MKMQFFTVPAHCSEDAQQRVNAFIAQHRIVAMEKHFVAAGTESFWSLCLTYHDGNVQNAGPFTGNRRERVDYREVLNEQDFALYAELRNLRKAMAEQEGIPAYALFTNEQLAEMVTRKVRSESELAQIEGVGKSRLEKYGRPFLQLLKTQSTSQNGKHDAPAAN